MRVLDNHVKKTRTMRTTVSLPFFISGILFTTCLLLANLLAVKVISIGPWTAPAGIIVFPVSYIINDLITEVYGYRKARLIIWIGFLMNFLMVAFIAIAIHLKSAPFWNEQDAFSKILGTTPRIVVASLIAYLTGSFTNAFIMSKMKMKSKGKNFSLRAIISTLAGEGLDSLLFILITFAGIFDFRFLFIMIISQAILKTLYEIIILPVTYYVVKYVKRIENINTIDEHISYNPFNLSDTN